MDDKSTEVTRLAMAYIAAIDSRKPGYASEACRLYHQLYDMVGGAKTLEAINEAAQLTDKIKKG